MRFQEYATTPRAVWKPPSRLKNKIHDLRNVIKLETWDWNELLCPLPQVPSVGHMMNKAAVNINIYDNVYISIQYIYICIYKLVGIHIFIYTYIFMNRNKCAYIYICTYIYIFPEVCKEHVLPFAARSFISFMNLRDRIFRQEAGVTTSQEILLRVSQS